MSKYELEDGRSATTEVQGRRLSEVSQKVETLTMSELLRRARNSRKRHRLVGEDGSLLGRIAIAVDEVGGLSFVESKALLISEAGRRITNGNYRAGNLLGISIDSVEVLSVLPDAEDKKDIFEAARQKIAQELDVK